MHTLEQILERSEYLIIRGDKELPLNPWSALSLFSAAHRLACKGHAHWLAVKLRSKAEEKILEAEESKARKMAIYAANAEILEICI